MQNYYSEFLSLALVYLLALMSPGPDFAITIKQSISYGRREGWWTSVGIGLGILVHVGYSILGLGLIISQSVAVFTIIKYLGALYLIYIGISALRSNPQTYVAMDGKTVETVSPTKAFLTGFITNVTNPKAALLFLALFSITINPTTPTILKLGYGFWMAAVTTLWFGGITFLFSGDKVRNLFHKFGHWFERVMGTVLCCFGFKLVLTEK